MSRIWDTRAMFYDICEGSGLRRGLDKAVLFQEMIGKTLFVALGTGLDIRYFPTKQEIIAIDISDKMLEKAKTRRERYQGRLSVVRADAMELCFPDASFDTVVTSCTMCSVPEPIRALREIRRVLHPDGKLLMFEHVRSRNPVIGWLLDLMTMWTRLLGTEMNRDTLMNLVKAGFHITRVESVYLDIRLTIHAVKRQAGLTPSCALNRVTTTGRSGEACETMDGSTYPAALRHSPEFSQCRRFHYVPPEHLGRWHGICPEFVRNMRWISCKQTLPAMSDIRRFRPRRAKY